MRGRWTDSEHATMFDHVARQSTSIYDDSRANRLILICAAKRDTPVLYNNSKHQSIYIKAKFKDNFQNKTD